MFKTCFTFQMAINCYGDNSHEDSQNQTLPTQTR